MKRIELTFFAILVGLYLAIADKGGIVNFSTPGFSLTSSAGIFVIFIALYFFEYTIRRKKRRYD